MVINTRPEGIMVCRALDKLRICVKYPIKISKNPIKMDDLRIKTLFKYTITQFFELCAILAGTCYIHGYVAKTSSGKSFHKGCRLMLTKQHTFNG